MEYDGKAASFDLTFVPQLQYMDIVSVEAHSKVSDLLTYGEILNFAMDPIFERPVVGSAERPNYKGGPEWPKDSHNYMVGKSDEKERIHPYFLAGLEMQHYLRKTGTTEEQCAGVVVKNKKNAFFKKRCFQTSQY